MSTEASSRVRSRLQRHEHPIFGFADEDEMTPEEKEALRQKGIDRELRSIIKSHPKELNTLRWATMYTQYLVDKMDPMDGMGIAKTDIEFSTRSDPDLSSLENLSLGSSGSSSQDPPEVSWNQMPTEERWKLLEVLMQRQEDAIDAAERSWRVLNTLVDKLTSGLRDHPLDDDIAYRVFNTHSKARYFETQGDIRCGRWQEFDVERKLKRHEAIAHTEGNKEALTDYISITTSPYRLFKIYRWEFRNQPDPCIAVIDLRVLRSLSIAHSSTRMDLNFRGIDYATPSHFLVAGWIPKQSILGFLPLKEFCQMLEKSSINTDSDAYAPIESGKKLDWELVRKKIIKETVVRIDT